MYARNYSGENAQQSFTRGEYNIPANYHGNAFTADEVPCINEKEPIHENPPCSDSQTENECQSDQGGGCLLDVENQPCTKCQSSKCNHEEKERKGLLGGLLSRFDKGFELDDLLIIGLILILMNGDKKGCAENRDEVIILLALLLLG